MAPQKGGAARSKSWEQQHNSSELKSRRDASVYDAVAGRCDTRRINAGDVSRPARPEEVLFRRMNAPDYIYAENRGDGEQDLYWANEQLAPGTELPDSNLLKSLHVYAADFYNRTVMKNRGVDERSMDGSALMALGILLEEAAKDCLGEKGHLVFVEGVEDEDEEEGEDEHGEDDDEGQDEGQTANAGTESNESTDSSSSERGKAHQRKRRKLDMQN